jgi:phage host-nuclease inhibitor protein Gam
MLNSLVFDNLFFFSKLFKLEKYNECVEYYRSLLKNNEDEYQSTRQANFIAALATWKLTDPSSKIQLVKEILLI